MIITEQKSLDEIIENLEHNKNVIIIGCGVCATTSKTGGEEQVNELKDNLLKHKINVLCAEVLEPTCDERKVKIFLNKNKEIIKRADAMIVMACGAGVQSFKHINAELKIFPALNTVFLATEKRLGEFYQFCSLCGNCILHLTYGICPVTRCPKGYSNGPCGGSKNNKCEANSENDCVWYTISQVGINQKIKKQILKNRDYSKQFHPRKQIKVKG